MKAKEALPYSLRKINEAETEKYPFQHILIEEVFHPDYYREMLAHFPDSIRFQMGAENAYRLDLIPDPAGGGVWDIHGNALEEQVEFWDDFKEHFLGVDFTKAILNMYGKVVNDVFICGRLCVDKKGSGIGPHRERFDKLSALVFSLADEGEWIPDIGTSILVPKDENLEATDEHYLFKDFNVIKSSGYGPNRLFTFAVTQGIGSNNSFHAYRHDIDRERRTIKCFIQHNIDPAIIRAEVAKTKALSRRWRKEAV